MLQLALHRAQHSDWRFPSGWLNHPNAQVISKCAPILNVPDWGGWPDRPPDRYHSGGWHTRMGGAECVKGAGTLGLAGSLKRCRHRLAAGAFDALRRASWAVSSS